MEKTRVIVSDIYLLDLSSKEEIRVLGEMIFGRSDGDKNFPQDSQISRKHFRLVPAEDVVLIEDLGSTNKTKVNGKLLKPSTLYKLRSRDVIEFGKQKMQIIIGGKIVGDATKMVSSGTNPSEPEAGLFERFVAQEDGLESKKTEKSEGADGIVRGVEGLDLQVLSDQKMEEKRDEALLNSLVQKKNAAWYLQFGGSEFGPVSLKELKVLVKSKQFQGGVLFFFTEGLTEWLPIDRLMKLIDDSHTEYTSTQRVGSGHPISGSVICHIRSRSERLAGQLESISHAEVTIVLTEPLVVQSALFELEVNPDSNTGMEPFKATVKADAARSAKNKHVLVFVQTSPKTKMSIERYLRSLPI